jgi:antirestriction protein ArdC
MLSQTEIRQNITNTIIESLKKGKIPWRKPWSGIDGPRTPTNFVTKRRYSGINIPILWAASQEQGYDVDYYATFNQWKSIGASIKKGAKAIHVVLFKPVKKVVREDDGTERTEQFPILRVFPVFSIHSVQGGGVEQLLNQPAGPAFEHEQREEFLRVVTATNAEVRYGGGSKAAYYRDADFIQMPEEGRFESFPAFAETLAHELGHWSEKRLEWTGSYAEGELRAELAAVFTVSTMMDISKNTQNHAAYIGSWLQALENDPKYIFRASAAASKAADFLLNFSRPQEESWGLKPRPSLYSVIVPP